ncbi:lung seven transmembrane receptor-domain-containing protein [Lipomyces oligophaga]|uniref:lung seven transmembrane receptor-domain-containing protein n=1 Tax=Lipomyces oligophaga TaxID=45792 RepID=UPI0034CF1155
MRTIGFYIILLSAVLIGIVGQAAANEATIADKSSMRQKCSGMYSRRDWGGSVDPYIEVALGLPDGTTAAGDSIVSIVVFEWTDVDLIGVDTGNPDIPVAYVCDQAAITQGLCDQDSYGQFLLQGATDGKINSAYTHAVTIKQDGSSDVISYSVGKTGFYCVGSYGMTTEESGYVGKVIFQNAFGQLPASQIPKLPFYGVLAIAYAVVFIFWMFLYVQYRSDILAVQNYITACAVFLMVEMVIVWGYYDLINSKGHSVWSTVYMVAVAILNAFRNAFTFFLLLIVCMGFGVVKPSLGPTMLKCRILAGLHFVFGVSYAISSFLITADTAGPLILLAIVPLAATMTAFYLWILSSLTGTIKDLTDRKQNVKALMYRRLWRLLFASILIIFGFFFLNSLLFADRNSADFVPRNWKMRWFVLDGWLNVVYFLDFVLIAFLWRPTRNNRRFAMSDELSQDDEGGFEIESLAGSLDEEGSISGHDEHRAVPSKTYDADSLAGSLHDPIITDDEDDDDALASSSTTKPAASISKPSSASTSTTGSALAKNGIHSETVYTAPEEDNDDSYDRWSEDDDYGDRVAEDSAHATDSAPALKKKDSSKDD